MKRSTYFEGKAQSLNSQGKKFERVDECGAAVIERGSWSVDLIPFGERTLVSLLNRTALCYLVGLY